jgi:DNA gyrase subunit A
MAIPIPDLRDGLTPQERLILIHLHQHLAQNTTSYIKTVKLLRSVYASHPAAPLPELYAVLLRMVRDWVCRYPLIINHGNVGSIDGDIPAPMRFNEMCVSPFGEAMFPDDGQGSPMAGAFPQILCNGAWAHSGKVALKLGKEAFASADGSYEPQDYVPLEDWEGGDLLSFIPPHNLGEIARGLIHLVDHPKAPLGDILQHIPAPDFPTGGTIVEKDSVRQFYETGKGSLTVQCKGKAEVGPKGRRGIAISELPFTLNKTVLIEKLAVQAHSGEYPWISDIRDLSSRNGVRVEIEIRRGYDEQKLFKQLRQSYPLEHRIDFKMVVADGDGQKTASLLDLMRGFVDHRRKMFRVDSSSKGAYVLTAELERWIATSDARRSKLWD